ncbi:LysE family transporter [Vibrio lentus]|nr:LysE family transporter [Vibrio lentus]
MLVGAGIGALVAQSALAFLLSSNGSVWLIFCGWAAMQRKWRDNSKAVKAGRLPALSSGRLLRNAVLINLTSPKSIVFLVALFPQFIEPSSASARLARVYVTWYSLIVWLCLQIPCYSLQMGRLFVLIA